MEDFIELGIEGADKMVDKHFDKLPDKYVHRDGYMRGPLKGRRKGSRDSQSPDNSRRDSKDQQQSKAGRESKSSQSGKSRRRDHTLSGSDSEYDPRQRDISPQPPLYTVASPQYPAETPYERQPFSRDPPRVRAEYLPQTAAYNPNPYYSPPPGINRIAMNRGRDADSYYSGDDDYHSDSYRAPRRPKAGRRRSSSYHGPRGRSEFGYGQQLEQRPGAGSGSDHMDKVVDRVKDKAHTYKLKDDINNAFTASGKGLAGGAVGAAVGAWAAQKAQVGYRKNGPRKDPNPVLTLLGAAVAGMAVNAAVDKWQDGKRDKEKSEDTYGSDDDSDGGRSHRSGRNDQRRRRRRDSYD